MKADKKQKVLNNIQHFEANELYTYIKSGDIAYDEMKATGKLNHIKQEEIEALLDADKKSQLVEENFWIECKNKRTIKDCNLFIASYPNSFYKSQALALKQQIEDDIKQQKDIEIENLKDLNATISIDYLKSLIDEGVLTKQDLYDYGIITPKALELFLDPPNLLTSYKENWKDLPKLPVGYTDAYMFGVAGSGKTMVLSGLMASAHKQGILDMNIDNNAGVHFSNQMLSSIKMGYVLPSTPTNALNYIAANIHKETPKKRKYPVSFIDMSGEHFSKTYEDGQMSDDISAKEYLTNNNRKLILFFIDYAQAISETKRVENADQGQQLQFALDYFDKDSTLAKTDAIHFIITKSDLMPEGEDPENHAIQFLDEHYKNLINTAKRYCQKHNINAPINNKLYVTPFTLGKFMLQNTFIHNPKPSQKLLNRVLGSVSPVRKGNWWEFKSK